MKRVLFSATCVALLLVGCGMQGKLTQGKAQRVIDRWVISCENKPGTIVIKGIRELPKENRADGDLAFGGFSYDLKNVFGGVERKQYSGSGVAHFVHYTDGRWILKRIDFGEGMDATWVDNIDLQTVPEEKAGRVGSATSSRSQEDDLQGDGSAPTERPSSGHVPTDKEVEAANRAAVDRQRRIRAGLEVAPVPTGERATPKFDFSGLRRDTTKK